MTPEVLLKIMPLAGTRAGVFAAPLTAAMIEFGIDKPIRQAAFLGEIAHESCSLRYTEELASGDAYEGRTDLGNIQLGDGRRFKGRGLIQITGRNNYQACGTALGMDLIVHPELLATTVNACRSAGWFWLKNNLNKYADNDRFGSLTKAINGGYKGLDDRIQFWLRARDVLL